MKIHGATSCLQWLTATIRRFYQPLARKALARPRTAIWASLASLPRRHRRRRQADRLQPVSEGGHAALPDHGGNAGRQQPRETDRALQFVEEKLHATPEVVSFFTNLGHGNPIMLLQRRQSRRRHQLWRRVRQAARLRSAHATPQVLERLRDPVQGISERAHLRTRVQQRAGDQRADRDSRDRPGSR
jgi:hypothetical protein